MSRRGTLIFVASACSGLFACLEDVDLESRRFACERPSDCVEGYYCHPADLVCVPTGTSTVASTDGGPRDAGGGDGGKPGLGEACEPAVGCTTGFCTDGFCCDLPCNGTCERCDLTPGVCTAEPDGADPANDCGDLTLQCELFTCGLDGAGACRACAAGPSAGTCNGARACRPIECPAAPGTILAECPNLACVGSGACPAGRAITEFDSTQELCARGQDCTLSFGDAGCCSLEGTCCPSPACSELDPACE